MTGKIIAKCPAFKDFFNNNQDYNVHSFSMKIAWEPCFIRDLRFIGCFLGVLH